MIMTTMLKHIVKIITTMVSTDVAQYLTKSVGVEHSSFGVSRKNKNERNGGNYERQGIYAKHVQDEINDLKLQLQHAEENAEVLTKNAEELKKQAVRDFAEKLKLVSVPMLTINDKPQDRAVFIEQIDELLEEYDK